MVVSVECTSCGVTLNIRNREILQRKMLCPQCREPLPLVLDAEEEAYVEAEINADESVEAAVVIVLGAAPEGARSLTAEFAVLRRGSDRSIRRFASFLSRCLWRDGALRG
jgi:peptide subunit release factor 1 (eRF1)